MNYRILSRKCGREDDSIREGYVDLEGTIAMIPVALGKFIDWYFIKTRQDKEVPFRERGDSFLK